MNSLFHICIYLYRDIVLNKIYSCIDNNGFITFYLTDQVPNVHDVLKLLASISAHWQEIGLSLAVCSNDLEKIQQVPDSAEVKLSKVINTWINTKSSPITWENVISSIEGPIVSNKKKGDEIRKYLHC